MKSVYRIRYKFLPNFRDLLDCTEVFVRATGYKEACQVLLDANFNWLDQQMVFMVGKVGGCYMEQFTSDDLE